MLVDARNPHPVVRIANYCRKFLGFCSRLAESVQWPVECFLRVKNQFSLVESALGNDDKARELRRSALKRRDALLIAHSECYESQTNEMDEMQLFDSLINNDAGRSTISGHTTQSRRSPFVNSFRF